jgi:hypothetical protein
VDGRADDPATTVYRLLLDGNYTNFADELPGP